MLRALAFEKLRGERFNAEVAATLATLAPRPYRTRAVEAIVAFEIMYDYLDGLTEQPVADPVRNGHQLYQAFTEGFTDDPPDPGVQLDRDYYRYNPHAEDGGYLGELADTVKTALAQLPAATTIGKVALASARRCAEAQTRVHAIPCLGLTQLEGWAMSRAATTTLQWREFLAGAMASVLAVHALIAAAADLDTTPEQAAAIDATYLSISALSTILDSLVDYDYDRDNSNHSHIQHYQDPDSLARQLGQIVRRAIAQAQTLPHAAHHIMTIAGVVAYYTSAPTASAEPARSISSRVHRELQPLIAPTLAVMRTWRAAKRLRGGLQRRPPDDRGRVL